MIPWYGQYNDMPPNTNEITKEEWWKRFSTCFYSRVDDKFFYNEEKDSKFFREKAIIYYDNTSKSGIGFILNTEKQSLSEPKIYFEFSECSHEFEITEEKRLKINQYRCKKCDYNFLIDSS